MPAAGWVAGLAAGLAALACFSPPPHPYRIARGRQGAAGVQTVLLLPLNVLVQLPTQLDRSTERVSRQIAAHLHACGREVVSMSLYEARQRLAQAAAAEGDVAKDPQPSDRHDPLVKRVVAALHEAHAFDAVVMPSLVYRPAHILQVTSDVVWDGVKRKLGVVGQTPESIGSIHLQSDFAGDMRGISLYVVVFDAGGDRVFESYGGLDLADEADITDAVKSWRWRMVPRNDPLSDTAALREGIAVAFDPYFPPPAQVAGQGS